MELGKEAVFIMPKSRSPHPAEYREQILELAEELEPRPRPSGTGRSSPGAMSVSARMA